MSDEQQNPNQSPLQEPSVLDYLKSLFRFGKGERIQLPEFMEEEQRSTISNQPLADSDQSKEIQSDKVAISQPATFQSFDQAQDRHSNIQTPFPWRSFV